MAAHYFGNVTTGWQGPGMIVPQMVWMPQDGHDIEGRPTVSFRPGISLGRALQMGPGQGFDMRPETTPRNRARFTLRIQWPGYPSWSTNINARERTQQAEPVPLWKLIKRIAESVQSFHTSMAPTRFDPTTGATWGLGQIPMDRLYLLELHNVSTGSWQPVISYVP